MLIASTHEQLQLKKHCSHAKLSRLPITLTSFNDLIETSTFLIHRSINNVFICYCLSSNDV